MNKIVDVENLPCPKRKGEGHRVRGVLYGIREVWRCDFCKTPWAEIDAEQR
jgi:hypothetical protein